MSIRNRLSCLFAGGALCAALLVAGAQGVAAASPGTCAGGSIAAGTYRSLSVTGICNVDSGDVRVLGGLSIGPGAGLNAAFAGSNLVVGGGLTVNGGLLVLGCEPGPFTCFNDPNQQTGTPGFQTDDTVGGGLQASGAILMLVHHSTISGGVSQIGGGGGIGCAPLFDQGPPPYTTYEDNIIRGGATVEGLRTCWSGFFRNTVDGSVNWNDNVTWDGTPESSFQDTILHGDDDGNEIANNRIQGNLNCFGNFPAVQFGDSVQPVSVVTGRVNGQCTAVV